MPRDIDQRDLARVAQAARVELDYIRRLGTNRDLVAATGNVGAYEALLILLSSDDFSMPVYKLLGTVQTQYSGHAGILGRLKIMRQLGLIDEIEGIKRSQVCLQPSAQLIEQIGPILVEKFENDQ